MAATIDADLLERLTLENELAVRRVRRMVDFLKPARSAGNELRAALPRA